jgi:hypothetical protein
MTDVDVVDDEDPTRIQGLPDAIQLESNIAFRVAAVVNEEVWVFNFASTRGSRRRLDPPT